MKRIAGALAGAALAVGLGPGAAAWAHPDRTPEQRAAARACLDYARQAAPDADRATIRQAARPCLEQVGITPGPFREKLRACVDEARRAAPDADRKELRPAVKECMGR